MAPFTRQQCAFTSWCLDLASVAVVILLFQAWIRDLHNTDETSSSTSLLSKSFLESGFCNSPTMNTQWMCACLDITAGVLFIALSLGGQKKRSMFSSQLTLPLAAYLLAHGYGHYQVATKPGSLEERTDLPTKDMAALAIILCIGPLGGMDTVLRQQQRNKNNNRVLYYSGVAVAVMALVALYKYGLGQKQNFALLYINLSILFTSTLPRLLLVGYSTETDMACRLDKHPYFWAKCCTGGMVVALVFLEPFYCDAFLARAGGHFLFDLSLLADAVCDLVNDSSVQQQQAGNSDTSKLAPKSKAV